MRRDTCLCACPALGSVRVQMSNLHLRRGGLLTCTCVADAGVVAELLLMTSTLSLRASAKQSPLIVVEIASSLRSSQ